MPLTAEHCRTLHISPDLFLDPEKARSWLDEKWEEIHAEGPAYAFPEECVHAPLQWAGGEYRGVYLGLYPKDRFEHLFHFDFFICNISHIQQDQFLAGTPRSYDENGYRAHASSQKNVVRDFIRGNVKQFDGCYSAADLQAISRRAFSSLPAEFEALKSGDLQFATGFLNDEEAGLCIATPRHYLNSFVVDDVSEPIIEAYEEKRAGNRKLWWKFW